MTDAEYAQVEALILRPFHVGTIKGMDVWLSVYAGYSADCRPRKPRRVVDRYETLEVGILADGKLVMPGMVRLLSQVNNYWVAKRNQPPVGAYVPVAKVLQIKEWLLKRVDKP